MALARVQYTADGATDVYSIPFAYITTDDVKVSVDGAETSQFIYLDGSTIKFNTPPSLGSLVDIRRDTEKEVLLVEFNDGSTLLESDLTLAAKQSFFIAQESFDQTGSSLVVADDGSYSASQRRISLLATPTEPTDAANKKYVDDVFTSGKDAFVERQMAEAARDAAQSSQEAAALSEANALSYRNTADSHRQAAAASASAASASESAAAASAAAAKASEDDVAANAQAAAESEANALSYKNSAESYKNTAVSSANAANSSETNASNSAAKASLWAEAPEDAAVEPGKYSAKHHAKKASASSASAAASATTAAGYRDTALTHRTAAADSAAEAKGYRDAALSHKQAAETSETNAANSASEAAGYAATLNLPNGDGQGGKFLRQKLDESGLEYATAVPSGGIIMWSGSPAAVPTGWALCDGNNGTPNLLDRFVVGAGGRWSSGETGGSADAVVVAHSHGASTGSAGNHSHSGSTNTTGNHSHSGTTSGGGGHSHYVATGHSTGSYDYGNNLVSGHTGSGMETRVNTSSVGNHTHSFSTNTKGNHSHSVSTNTTGSHTHSVSVSSTGVSATDKNLPPYYALAFIMKL